MLTVPVAGVGTGPGRAPGGTADPGWNSGGRGPSGKAIKASVLVACNLGFLPLRALAVQLGRSPAELAELKASVRPDDGTLDDLVGPLAEVFAELGLDFVDSPYVALALVASSVVAPYLVTYYDLKAELVAKARAESSPPPSET